MRLFDGLKPAGLGDCRHLGLCNSGGSGFGVAFTIDGQRYGGAVQRSKGVLVVALESARVCHRQFTVYSEGK